MASPTFERLKGFCGLDVVGFSDFPKLDPDSAKPLVIQAIERKRKTTSFAEIRMKPEVIKHLLNFTGSAEIRPVIDGLLLDRKFANFPNIFLSLSENPNESKPDIKVLIEPRTRLEENPLNVYEYPVSFWPHFWEIPSPPSKIGNVLLTSMDTDGRNMLIFAHDGNPLIGLRSYGDSVQVLISPQLIPDRKIDKIAEPMALLQTA